MTHGYSLADRLTAGETVYTVWSSLPDLGLIEVFAQGPFGAVTLDMQHGAHHVESVLRGLSPVITGGKSAIVRIAQGDFGMASRALDMGADAVIAPMINSIEDARAFRDAMKYPPVGGRSWGPTRALKLRGLPGGSDHLETANAKTLAFAMIETREAYAIAADIAAMDGIDGLFVGPSDFSIAWSNGAEVNPALDDMQDAVADVARIAREAGKHSAIFAADPSAAPRYVEFGYRFLALGMETGLLEAGQKAILAAAKA